MSNPKDCRCYEKAVARGDQTFTVVGQDITSPTVVCEWIKLNIETAPADKLRCALEDALTMRATRKRKHAD